MTTKSTKDFSAVNDKKDFTQKLVIPKGVINPEDTIVIEIPSNMRSVPILLAERQPAYLEEILNKKWNGSKMGNRTNVVEQKVDVHTKLDKIIPRSVPPPVFPQILRSNMKKDVSKEKFSTSTKPIEMLTPFLLPLTLPGNLLGTENNTAGNKQIMNKKKKSIDTYQQTSIIEVDMSIQAPPLEYEKSFHWDYGFFPHTIPDNSQKYTGEVLPLNKFEGKELMEQINSPNFNYADKLIEIDPDEELADVGIDRVRRYPSFLFIQNPQADYEWTKHKCTAKQEFSRHLIQPEFYQVKEGSTQTLCHKSTGCECQHLEEDD